MTQYGPLRDAPNPVQRLFARSALAGAAFFGVTMAAFFNLPIAFTDISLRTRLILSGSAFCTLTAVMYLFGGGRKMTTEERGSLLVAYMPWFRGGKPDGEGDALPSPPSAHPFSRLLVRRTIAGSAARGAVFGASLALPFWSHRPLVAVAATAVGAGLGAFAFRRSARG